LTSLKLEEEVEKIVIDLSELKRAKKKARNDTKKKHDTKGIDI